MASEKTSPLGCFAAVFLGLVVSPVTRGMVMHVLWTWFVVPTFHVPTPRVAVLLGLNCLVGMFGPLPTNKPDDEVPPVVHAVVGAVVVPAVFLAFGWVYHQF